MRNIISFFTLCLMLLTACGVTANENYKIYNDAAGNIYLEAPPQFVLIHGDVAIPLVIVPKNGLLKLSKAGGKWELIVLSKVQWLSLQLVSGSPLIKSISFADLDGDGSPDIHITFHDNQPPITITSLTTIAKMSVSASPPTVVTYMHTDVLGSVVAETDANGNVIKKTEYKPFGESKDN